MSHRLISGQSEKLWGFFGVKKDEIKFGTKYFISLPANKFIKKWNDCMDNEEKRKKQRVGQRYSQQKFTDNVFTNLQQRLQERKDRYNNETK
jgi:hypothetical protein